MTHKSPLSEKQKKKEQKALQKSERIYQGKIINLRLETLVFEDRAPAYREYVEHQGGVAVIAVDSDENLLFIQQYRRAVDELLLEIPAGILEKGEDPKHAAKRELQEETGYEPGELISLGGFFVSPGFCNEYIHLFLALHLKKNPLPCDLDEAIDLCPLTIQQFYTRLEKNQIRDCKTIAAVLLYLQWKNQKNS
jgi:ADP-ribose pyrophosphatase